MIVNIYGNDLDVLDADGAGGRAASWAGSTGATEVQLQSPPGLPQLTIRPRKADLERWGMDTVDVLNVLRAAYQGDIVGQSYEGNRVFNVITILDKESRNNVANVANLPLRTPRRQLRAAAPDRRRVSDQPAAIRCDHLGGQRVQAVTANVIGRDVASFVAEARDDAGREGCSCPRACTSSSRARRRRRRRRGAI